MTNVIIIVILSLVTGWAVYKTIQKSKKGGGCCGEHEEGVKRIPVQDRNKKHYLYQKIMTIGGMTCENCAIRVENELNALPGVWAKVDIAEKKAVVLLKENTDESVLRNAVIAAGYVVTDITLRNKKD